MKLQFLVIYREKSMMKWWQKGVNISVLSEWKMVLGNEQYRLPNIPSYDVLISFCTCQTRKEPILTVKDEENNLDMSFGFTQTCPVNHLYAVLGRQAATQVSPDPGMMK